MSNQADESDVSWGAGQRDGKVSLTMDQAINRLGCGKFQYIVFVAVGLCMASDAMEVTLLSYLSAVLRKEWGLTAVQAATVTASVFAGQMAGALILGPLGDRIGRRPVFIISGAIISVFGVLTAVAQNVTQLVIIRALVGFGVGGLVVPFDILAEFLPVDRRGVFLLSVEYFWTIGSLLVTIFAYYTFGSGGSWVGFVILCAIPCFTAVFFAVMYVPESPRWLVSQGRKEEALVVLRTAARRNGYDEDEMFPLDTELADVEEEESANFGVLLKPKWRRLTLLLWVVWFGMAFGYYGTILAVTRVFEEGGVDQDGNPTFNYAAIFISSAAEFIGLTFVVLTVENVGRIWPMTANFVMGGIFVCLLSVAAGSQSDVFLTTTAFLGRSVEMGASCLLWVTTAEVLNTEIRTTGHSASNAVARLGGFLCPFLVEGDTSFLTVGISMLILHLITATAAFHLPETKGLELGQISPNKKEEPSEGNIALVPGETGDRTTRGVRPPYGSVDRSYLQTSKGDTELC